VQGDTTDTTTYDQPVSDEPEYVQEDSVYTDEGPALDEPSDPAFDENSGSDDSWQESPANDNLIVSSGSDCECNPGNPVPTPYFESIPMPEMEEG
jgi:hypothetical protein